MRNLTPDSKSTATSLTWLPNSEGILVTGIDAGETFVARLTLAGAMTPVWKGPESLAHGEFVPYVSVASDGTTTAVVRETFSNAPEVWAGPVGDWKQITHVNANIKPEWGEAKSLRWTTSIGSVQGWLIYPEGFRSRKKISARRLRSRRPCVGVHSQVSQPLELSRSLCPSTAFLCWSRIRAAATEWAKNSRGRT